MHLISVGHLLKIVNNCSSFFLVAVHPLDSRVYNFLRSVTAYIYKEITAEYRAYGELDIYIDCPVVTLGKCMMC